MKAVQKVGILSLIVIIFVVYAAIGDAFKTKADYIKTSMEKVEQLEPAAAKAKIDEGAVVLDVRVLDEYQKYHIPNAILIPRGFIEFKIDDNDLYPEINRSRVPAKDDVIVMYCELGGRGLLSSVVLKEMGYVNVFNIKGGMKAWMKDKLPIEK